MIKVQYIVLLSYEYERKSKISHLKESFSSGSSGLQHNGQDGEDDNLNGGTSSIPVWSTDSILKLNTFQSVSMTFIISSSVFWCEI